MILSPSFYDLTLSELTAWVVEQGQSSYRVRQIFQALYRQDLADPKLMKQLPADFRALLARSFPARPLVVVEMRRSSDGTVKWLSELPDGQLLETVLIPAESRKTICLSTQVGCAYGCAFCASGMDGFQRNLTTGEIVQQLLMVQRQIKQRVTNVVFMGMGEPLANYESLMKAIRIMNSPEGLRIGARKITISTVGLVPMIERLSREGLQVELSVSLHAPTDELRGQLMPVNRKYPISELIVACRTYVQATKRLITFEYILIDQVNDSLKEAQELAKLLEGLLCKINLIPCHPIPGAPWGRPALPRMLVFEKYLRGKRIACTLRRSRGLDIEGACGQLRLRQEDAAPGASAHRLRQEGNVVK